MSARYIECSVRNEFVSGAGQPVGAAGSHHDVYLRLTFGSMWTDLSKYVTFRDALGENPTVVILLPAMTEDGITYDVPVPAAAKAKQGNMMVTVKGYTVTDGTQEESATLTTTAYFRVMPSDYAMLDDESIDATLAQQLQAQIQDINADILDARDAAKDSEAWAVGEIDGEDVDNTDPRYHNNSKYYSEQASGSASASAAAEASAAGSATAAAASADAAAASAGAAAGSASTASGAALRSVVSADDAESAKDYAAASAEAAAGSAASAAGSASDAAVSAANAADSAGAAAGSATEAAGSATSAATSASYAARALLEGQRAASFAGQSATNAGRSEEAASTSAAAAAGSAGDASDGAVLAKSYAVGGTDTRVDVVYNGGEFTDLTLEADTTYYIKCGDSEVYSYYSFKTTAAVHIASGWAEARVAGNPKDVSRILIGANGRPVTDRHWYDLTLYEGVPGSVLFECDGRTTLYEDTDNARFYSDLARVDAVAASRSETAAAGSAAAAQASAGAAAGSATAAQASADAAGTNAANASSYASAAAGSADAADGSAGDSEAWAVGKRGGTDVPATDPTYHNNAKYWAAEAQAAAGGGVSSFNGRNGAVLPQSGDYTAAMVGAIPTTAKGAANGVAELDASGRVPSAQLPAYVDDVLEYDMKAQFPATGESGKIYVDKLTNKTYRWGGTEYVEISESLALGETAGTAYAGNKGKANADAIAELQNKANKPKQAYVNLSATWSGTGPYTQVVTISGTTSNSKIDLQPTAAQIASLIASKVQGLYIENNAGTLTAYAVGAKPGSSMTLQCTVTEVTT